MGTRTRVEIFAGNQCLVSIYRQFDGYPSGMGADLLALLDGGKLVNGLSSGGPQKVFNGIEELAAIVVWGLKKDEKDPATFHSGNVYIMKPMTEDGECGEEYLYRIIERDGQVHVQVTGGDMTAFGAPNDPASFRGLFSGDVAAFSAWIKSESE